MSLMPQTYVEKIPAGHLVRLVKEAIEALDLEILLASLFMILRYFLLSFFRSIRHLPGLSQNVTFATAQVGIVEKSYKNG